MGLVGESLLRCQLRMTVHVQDAIRNRQRLAQGPYNGMHLCTHVLISTNQPQQKWSGELMSLYKTRDMYV